MGGADWGPVAVAVVLFVVLSPGLLFQLPARRRVLECGNMTTSGISILKLGGRLLEHRNQESITSLNTTPVLFEATIDVSQVIAKARCYGSSTMSYGLLRNGGGIELITTVVETEEEFAVGTD
ncbi:unnamed protein product [Brassica oleracea]